MTDLFGDLPTEVTVFDLGRMIAGGKGKRTRERDDYYPTPARATRQFLTAEHTALSLATRGNECPIWEPCGRGGAIVREIISAGFLCTATDIVPDPAHAVEEANLMTLDRARSSVAVTNPPFNLADPMIRHLLGTLRCRYLALLLKSSFWHAKERTSLFQKHRPARIYAMNWRPDFLGGGAPTMDCIWTVWDGISTNTIFSVLTDPVGDGLFDEAS